MKIAAFLASAAFANDAQPRACTDVTTGITGKFEKSTVNSNTGGWSQRRP